MKRTKSQWKELNLQNLSADMAEIAREHDVALLRQIAWQGRLALIARDIDLTARAADADIVLDDIDVATVELRIGECLILRTSDTQVSAIADIAIAQLQRRALSASMSRRERRRASKCQTRMMNGADARRVGFPEPVADILDAGATPVAVSLGAFITWWKVLGSPACAIESTFGHGIKVTS